MARPTKARMIENIPSKSWFKEVGEENGNVLEMYYEEFEVIRLIDYEHLSQSQCALHMHISRSSVQALYEEARKKLARFLVEGGKLHLVGGHYEILKKERTITMKIAVTYDQGMVFQHFGKTETFKIYEVDDNQIVDERLMSNQGKGHGALVDLLKEAGVDVLICGGIGAGARNFLNKAGITLFAGAVGDCDRQVEAYLNGTLPKNEAVDCHEHEGHHCHHEDGHKCCH